LNKIGPRWDQIRENYPVTDECPTCRDATKYKLDGQWWECDCQYQKVLQMHYFAANIPREYHTLSLDDYTSDASDVLVPPISDYLDRFDSYARNGIGLTFNGPQGTGKTFAVACILKELVKRGRRVFFVTFDDLILAWSATWKNDEARVLERKIKSVECLGMDEWKTDARNSSGFLANGIESVLRWRTSNQLPTLITTNLTPTQERKEFARTFSLLAAKNLRVSTSGADIRQDVVRVRNFELAHTDEARPLC
jgi:DNA replication protein DnaC